MVASLTRQTERKQCRAVCQDGEHIIRLAEYSPTSLAVQSALLVQDVVVDDLDTHILYSADA